MKISKLLSTEKIYYTMPEGWDFIKGATTAPTGYKWICNKKSFFSGERKQALLKVNY